MNMDVSIHLAAFPSFRDVFYKPRYTSLDKTLTPRSAGRRQTNRYIHIHDISINDFYHPNKEYTGKEEPHRDKKRNKRTYFPHAVSQGFS